MQCHKCEIDLTSIEHQMVGPWPFCADCFKALLEKKPKTNVEEVSPESETVASSKTTSLCHLCEKDLIEGQSKKVGIWLFCPDCYLSLNSSPHPEQPEEEVDLGPVGVRPITLDPISFVFCSACERRINSKGAKRFNSVPHCPECSQKLLNDGIKPDAAQPEVNDINTLDANSEVATEEEVTARVRISVTSNDWGDGHFSAKATGGPNEPQIAGGEKKTIVCDACNKSDCSFKEVQGFKLCTACRTTDLELALELAREQHKRRMLAIKNSMLT